MVALLTRRIARGPFRALSSAFSCRARRYLHSSRCSLSYDHHHSSNTFIDESFTQSNAFGEKKTDEGFGSVIIPPRPASALESPHVFVTNLPRKTPYEVVRHHMSAAGEVKYARVFSKQGQSTSTAMVEYYDMESAAKALVDLHCSKFGENVIWVREFSGATYGNYENDNPWRTA